MLWSDGTVAHFIKLRSISAVGGNTEFCTILSIFRFLFKGYPLPLTIIKCDDMFHTSCLLCEIPDNSMANETLKPPEVQATKSPSNALQVTYCILVELNLILFIFFYPNTKYSKAYLPILIDQASPF